MSAVRIDELTSEVVTDESATGATQQVASAAGAAGTVWQEQARYRALRDRTLRDAARTTAEAYGD